MSWRDNAACRGRPTAWWFAPVDSPEARLAFAYCDVCPVRDDCQADAYANNDSGIRGGRHVPQRSWLPTSVCVQCELEFVGQRMYCSSNCRKKASRYRMSGRVA